MIYVVGNEQNYHFQVLSILLDKLGFEWGKGLVHFSYGMVELPEGKMKSREGTVVDADDLMAAMIETAKETSAELGKLDGLTQEEADNIARIVGLGALKYFILKVDARKNLTFNPKEVLKDTDTDGMPDKWEKEYGLDPKNAADGKADTDKDGYTNLEEYLNGTPPTEFQEYRDVGPHVADVSGV